MPTLSGAAYIADFLIQQRVPYVFGLCGHGILGLLDGLYDRRHEITTISVHHEAVAGFMADAYFRITQKPVATYTSCGPGSANLVVAVAAAFADSSAMLTITGQRAHRPVEPRPVPGDRTVLPGRFRQRAPALREAELPAHAGGHAPARDAPGLRAHDERPARASARRRAPERVRGARGRRRRSRARPTGRRRGGRDRPAIRRPSPRPRACWPRRSVR